MQRMSPRVLRSSSHPVGLHGLYGGMAKKMEVTNVIRVQVLALLLKSPHLIPNTVPTTQWCTIGRISYNVVGTLLPQGNTAYMALDILLLR